MVRPLSPRSLCRSSRTRLVVYSTKLKSGSHAGPEQASNAYLPWIPSLIRCASGQVQASLGGLFALLYR